MIAVAGLILEWEERRQVAKTKRIRLNFATDLTMSAENNIER